MNERRQTLRLGIVALVKALLLIIAVPLTLVRLWEALPHQAVALSWHTFANPSTWAEIVVIAVAELWLVAVIRLVGDVARAFYHRSQIELTSWSTRWASAIAGLFLFISVGTLLSGGVAGAATKPIVGASISSRSISSRQIKQAVPEAIPPPEGPSLLDSESRHGPFGFDGVACAAIALQIASERRRRLATRQPNAPVTLPPVQLAQLHRDFIDSGQQGGLELVDQAHRFLQATSPEHFAALSSALQLVTVTEKTVHLHFNVEVPRAVHPFSLCKDATAWYATLHQLRTNERQQQADVNRGRLVLVPIGQSAHGNCLVALRPWVSLGITGTAQEVDETLTGLVVGLYSLPWATDVEVTCVGSLFSKVLFGHNVSTATMSMLEDFASRQPDDVARQALGRANVIVLDRDSARSISRTLIRSLQRSCVLLIGGQEAGVTLSITGKDTKLQPHNIALRTPRLTAQQLQNINMLCCSSSHEAMRLMQATAPSSSRTPPRREPREAPVELVGRITLFRQQPTFANCPPSSWHIDHPLEISLLTYLALHDQIASVAQLRHALTNGRRSAQRHFDAALRAAIAHSIVSVDDEHVIVEGSLVTDGQELSAALRTFRTMSDTSDQGAILLQALSKVHGSFTSRLSAFQWLAASDALTQIHADTLDAAYQLSLLALQDDLPDLALWAIGKGQLIEPASELMMDVLLPARAHTHGSVTARQDFREFEDLLTSIGESEPGERIYARYCTPMSGQNFSPQRVPTHR